VVEMKLSPKFKDAAEDYLFLLKRGYSAGKILPLVSSRYQLSGTERSMLYRGIFLHDTKTARLKMLVSVPVNPLHIDGFNVLITIASYLQGLPVFIACDGFLRDAAYLRGKIQSITTFEPAIDLLIQNLQHIEGEHTIYLDQEVALHKKIDALLAKRGIKKDTQPNLVILENVDKKLISVENGSVCTSDTEIIEKTSCVVFDLARHVISDRFNPDLFDLGRYLFAHDQETMV
jgi:hypothetical protein